MGIELQCSARHCKESPGTQPGCWLSPSCPPGEMRPSGGMLSPGGMLPFWGDAFTQGMLPPPRDSTWLPTPPAAHELSWECKVWGLQGEKSLHEQLSLRQTPTGATAPKGT